MKRKVFSMLVLAASILSFGCKTSKTEKTVSTEQLAGKWNVTQVAGNEVKAEKTPFIDFAAENRVHAELGCNLYNSTYTYEPTTGELTFAENGQRTMMFCPDMPTEDAIIKAIGETRKIRQAEAGNCLELLDAQGAVLLVMCK